MSEQKLGLGKGLYAVFETTMGEMICRLEEEKAPETVKNFVGLATGEKEYTDPRTREKARGPYYDGTIFHRIIAGFMIQGGDPTGTGTGGPGYRFNNEVHPTLKHDKVGVLAMANAGPNTNGSQFYITLAAAPWLNGGYSIFGQLVKGEDVLKKIGSVETGANDRPRQEVGLKHVRIVREA